MATYKGGAFCAAPDGPLGGTRRFAASMTNAADNPGDDPFVANWDRSAGTTLTVLYNSVTSGADPAAAPNLVDIELYDGNSGTLVDTAQLSNPANSGESVELNPTTTGTSGGTPITGVLRLRIRARKTDGAGGVGNYDVNSENGAVTSHRGIFRFNPTSKTVAEAGGGSTPRSFPNNVRARVTLSHPNFSNISGRNFTCVYRRSSDGVAFATDTTANTSSATKDTSLRAVNNVFPLANTTFFIRATPSVSDIVPDSETSLTWISGGSFDSATFNIDPRIFGSVHAEKDDTFTPGGNITSYGIAADELFVWAVDFVNAAGTILASQNVTQRLKRPNGSIVVTDTTKTTDVNGDTPNPGVNWTSFLTAPAGNWTQEAFLTNASWSVLSQTLGFSSPYTANRKLALHVESDVSFGGTATLMVEYREKGVGRIALDAAPTLRIYSVDETTGVETEELAEAAMTAFGSPSAYKRSWTPSATGLYMIEVEGTYAGGSVQDAWAVRVTAINKHDAYSIDPTGVFK